MINLHAIVAKSQNNVIGVNGSLPWRLPEDLKHFKETTEFHYVIMGRKTVESLPSSGLPNRKIIALTNNKEWVDKRCHKVFHDIDSLLDFVEHNRKVSFFVAGGSEIYEQMLPFVDTQIISEVNDIVHYEDADSVSKYPTNYFTGFRTSHTRVLSDKVVVKYLKRIK